jgi:hypothetical protein
MFVDPDNYHFALRAESPAVDAGKDAAQYHDAQVVSAKGASRNDMGATGGPYAFSGKLHPVWPPPRLNGTIEK